MGKNKNSEASDLRQKAEELLKKKLAKSASRLSEADPLKMVHELEVYKTDLELQNEELRAAKNRAEADSEKYTELYDYAPSAYFSLSKEGKIIEINLTGAKMLGRERSKLKGSRLVFFVTNDTKTIFNQFLEKTFNSKARESCEVILSTNGNLSIYVHLSGIINENQEQCLVTGTDITELKMREDKLKELSLYNEAILASVPNIIMQVDNNKVYTLANNAGYEFFGHDVIGKEASFYFEGEQKTYQSVEPFFTGNQENIYIESWQRRRDGKKRLLAWWCHVLKDINGKVTGVLSSATDITDERERQEEIKVNLTKYKLLFDTMPAGVTISDKNGNLIESNLEADRLLGISREEQLKRKIEGLEWKIVKPDGSPVLPDDYASVRALKENKTVSNIEMGIDHGKGNITWINVTASPIPLENYGVMIIYYDITERRQAEEALRNSQNMLSNALKLAHFGTWEFNVKDDLFTFNDSFYAIFRTTAGQVGGYTMSSGDYANRFVHPEDASLVGMEVMKAIETEDPDFTRQIEHRILYADGEVGYISVRFFIVKDDKGKTVKTFGINQDITERIQAEKSIRQSEENIRKLSDQIHHYLSSSPTVIYSMKMNLQNHETVWITENITREFGYSMEEALSPKWWTNNIHPDDLERVLPEYEKIFIENSVNCEYRFLKKDRTEVWIYEEERLVRDKDGNPSEIIGSWTAITKRKHAEDIIKLNEMRLQLQIELHKLMDAPQQQVLEFLNEAILQTAQSRFAFIGLMDDSELIMTIHAWSKNAMAECEFDNKSIQFPVSESGIWGNSIRERRAIIINNYVYPHPDKKGYPAGHVTIHRYLGVPIFDGDKIVAVGAVANKETDYNISDIAAITALLNKGWEIIRRKRTEQDLIKAKEKAEESDRLKSAFLTNISHEIRTPMNGILGFTSLLKEPNLAGEEQQEFIEIIEKSGDRMLNTINDLIDISMIESGQMNVSISGMDINELTKSLFSFFKPEVEEKGMKLILKNSLPAKDSIIKTDQDKLYSILTNLIKNAVKYSLAGQIEFGYILNGSAASTSSTSSAAGKSGIEPVEMQQGEPGSTEQSRSTELSYSEPVELMFYVKDTGLGITKEQQEFIFERFRQGSEFLTRKYEGSGLGLSISKAFVEMLSGKIWVESEKGVGSTFYFTIPYNTGNDQETESKDARYVVKPDHQDVMLKILIAEDEEYADMHLSILLKNSAKEILHAKNGFETLEICRSYPDIDLILMDIKMTEMDGYEATRQIRQFNKDIIIIAQTAYALTGEREKAIEAGCNDYISKPINKDFLMELIKKYFK